MLPFNCSLVAKTCLALSFLASIAAAQITLRLPTGNDALFSNSPQDFYMYVDRNYEGVRSKPWEGGCYGFTRTPVKTAEGPVCIKFHEGIDIKPMKRDARGNPLDEVRPIAGGRVVHVSDTPGDSSYGRYIVIEHKTPEGPLYSLYAHLSQTACRPGDVVGTGNVIGTLGFTGVGINRERSHLHLEIGLLLNKNFQQWYDSRKIASPNKHGLYNGLNLCGIDPASALLHCKEGKPFSIKDFLASLRPEYTMRVPAGSSIPDIAARYPFLLIKNNEKPASWEIAFSDSGVPLSIAPSGIPCAAPVVIKATPHPFSQLYRTVNRISGSSKKPILTPSGESHIRLIMEGSTPQAAPVSTP